MSTESYQKWWIIAKKNLENVKGFDKEMQKQYPKLSERSVAGRLVGGLYARYCMIVQEVGACLDQMCQIQKSYTVRKMMDAAATRLNELKDEMLKIDISEYHYIDGSLIELKLIPHSIEILHPDLIFPRSPEIREFWNSIKKGEKIYVPPPPGEEPLEDKVKAGPIDPLSLLLRAKKSVTIKEPAKEKDEEAPKEEAPKEEEKEEEEAPKEEIEKTTKTKHRQKAKPKKAFVLEVPELTEDEIKAQEKKEKNATAITVIQTAERARQSRLYFYDLYAEFKARKVVKKTSKVITVAIETLNNAATMLQKNYRRRLVQQSVQRMELKRRLTIGMYEPSWVTYKEFEKFQLNLEARRAVRDEHITQYIKAHREESARILRVVGPGLFEDIGDEIRFWFYDWYTRARCFQLIPNEDKGGSILIVRGETITIEEYMKAKTKKEKPKTKEQLAKEKKTLEAKKKKEKEQAKKAAAAKKKADALKKKQGLFEIELGVNRANDKFETGFDEYKKIWDQIKDSENPNENHYMYMITEEKCYKNQLEIRQQVDEMMRLELEILLEAQRKDVWQAKKKKGAYKPKKAKKPKKKKKKKKGKKDPTGSRKVEDLFQELVDSGIIHTYEDKFRIKDFKGDFSYQNWEKRALLYDPPPTLGDVRQAVVLNCIMPLGAESMSKPKSVLIIGHRECGKHLLANAIFNETNCVLFDLTPKVLAESSYKGKKGNKMLIHLITKMSRLLQPSIIYVDGAEKPFYKKVPKDEKATEPKRVGKLLKKLVKPIQPSDRVMVLGISSQPWAGQAGALKKTYEKIIFIPRSDYGSVYLYWRELLMPYHGVDRNIDISALVQLTVQYPLSELRRAVEQILTPRRRIELRFNPLRQSELLSALLEGTGPITDKEFAKFIKWYNKTNVGKQKAAQNAINNAYREKMNKAKKKK